jgi:Ala-tRNA(Pro) deacylase
VSGQQLAQVLHISGHRVAKAVIVEIDGRKMIAVVPASRRLDLLRLTEELGFPRARLVTESEFARLFPGCELGAEPPFGGLYGMPVVVDTALASADTIVVRAGSHKECIELAFTDFVDLESPKILTLSSRPPLRESRAQAHTI